MSVSWTDLDSLKSLIPMIEVDEIYSIPIHMHSPWSTPKHSDKTASTLLLELSQVEVQGNLRYQSQNDHKVNPIPKVFRLDLSLQDIFDVDSALRKSDLGRWTMSSEFGSQTV
jgi:hypothetical protein